MSVPEIRIEIYRYLILTTPKFCLKPTSDHSRGSRYLSILGTNHQIYSEAASVLYSDLIIVVHPGYVSSLRKSNSDSIVFEKPIQDVWRHDPLQGIGHRKRNGKRFYYTPAMDGLMDPHIFAKFQKIDLQARLRYGEYGPFLWINNYFLFDADTEERSCTVMRKTTLMKNLAKLLSYSPLLKELSIHLDVHVDIADSTWYLGTKTRSPEEIAHRSHLRGAAQERGAAIFVDSGMLDPLLQLSNVKHFTFSFRKVDHTKKDGYTETYVEAAKDIKHHIEGNWVGKKNS